MIECTMWITKYGTPTHYCLGGNPPIDCPTPGRGCKFSQYKPVYHRMQRRVKQGGAKQMTKRDEIREGIIDVLKASREVAEFTIHDGYDLDEEKATDKILSYLHSKDVVVKVERELPLPYEPGVLRPDGRSLHMGREISGRNYQQKIIEAGYVAVEPLVANKSKGGERCP